MKDDSHREQRGPFDSLRAGGPRAPRRGSVPTHPRAKAWQCGHRRCHCPAAGGGAATTMGFCSSGCDWCRPRRARHQPALRAIVCGDAISALPRSVDLHPAPLGRGMRRPAWFVAPTVCNVLYYEFPRPRRPSGGDPWVRPLTRYGRRLPSGSRPPPDASQRSEADFSTPGESEGGQARRVRAVSGRRSRNWARRRRNASPQASVTLMK